jgi:hypothetical protein
VDLDVELGQGVAESPDALRSGGLGDGIDRLRREAVEAKLLIPGEPLEVGDVEADDHASDAPGAECRERLHPIALE